MGTEGRQAGLGPRCLQGRYLHSSFPLLACKSHLRGRKQGVPVQEEAEGDLICLVMGKKWQVWALGQRALRCLVESGESH